MEKPSTTHYRGFLWKPKAAHFNRALTVLPESFVLRTRGGSRCPVGQVDIFDIKGNRRGVQCIKSRDSGVCAPGQLECVYRPSFLDQSTTGEWYRKNVGKIVVRAYYYNRFNRRDPKNDKCYIWVVRDPSRRSDGW